MTHALQSQPFPLSFRHQALFYRGPEEFVARVSSFVRAGIRSGESVVVAVGAEKIVALRAALGGDARTVHFADMAAVSANPARVIPAWTELLATYGRPGCRLRGVGEPMGAVRTPAELVECQRHEALLNVAFATSEAWSLLCPYDTGALPSSVIATAHLTHPLVADSAGERTSAGYLGLDASGAPFDDQLPEPATDDIVSVQFDAESSISSLRHLVGSLAARSELDIDATNDVILAVSELLTNSVRHGGGRGQLRVWSEGDRFCFEVHDGGRILEPLAGRTRPPRFGEGGRGLWLVNQLCDLVQVRNFPGGTVVRVHKRRSSAA